MKLLHRAWQRVLFAVLVVLVVGVFASPMSNQHPLAVTDDANRLSTPQFRYEAIPGFFQQTDPQTDDESYPLAPPRLGLIDDSEDRWATTFQRIAVLQSEVRSDGGVVRLLFLQRHGQGEHNVAEAKYGSIAWNEYWSKQEQYFDPALTALGLDQLATVRDNLHRELKEGGLPVPSLVVSSPLSRCLNTTSVVWGGGALPATQLVFVREPFRETYGDHTCDRRRDRSELAKKWTHYDFSGLWADKDPLWTPERETDEHVKERISRAFDPIFEYEELGPRFVGIVCHGGVIEAAIAVTKHRGFSVPPGGMLPMVVVGWPK
ncbi:hypothetical protein HKX48_006163 [Thoreauomyces humboldtii]|nr:hypothetical protein HKX48_006163 [Thoreauomyces humboldtii]